MSTGISPQETRIQARENIKDKARKQIERTEIEELNKSDYVRVKMSSIYSEIIKEVKAGDMKIFNVSYTLEIYRVFKAFHENHQKFERKRYTLKNFMVHHYILNLILMK